MFLALLIVLLMVGFFQFMNSNYAYSIFCHAISKGTVSDVRIILSINRNLAAKGRGENLGPPLNIAASQGREEICKLLINNGADVNMAGTLGNTPLQMASAQGRTRIVELLLSNGAKVNERDIRGRTALHDACACYPANYWDIVSGRPGPNDYDDVIELLIANGANTNAADNDGMTALHLASSYAVVAAVKCLVSHGAKIMSADHIGRTALHYAATGRLEIAKLLLSLGADPNARDIEDTTPLHLAVKYGCKDVVELLVHEHADINQRDRNGFTPLRMAFKYSPQLVRYLRARGARI